MLINADCIDALKQLPNDSVDSLITDPPYGIAFMGKSWDDALPSIDIWKEAYRVMKPGAFGFICCIPRQDCLSRMMISLEDAGFNINFTSLYWTYASGFPKAMNIGKAIDKRLGAEREVVGINKNLTPVKNKIEHEETYFYRFDKLDMSKLNQITAPATPDAKRLDGSYAGFQPKPAVEVIIVVMKPRSEPTYIDQALKNGKGVVWFDDCRIPYKDENIDFEKETFNPGYFADDRNENSTDKQYKTNGRFPANLLVSDDVLDDGKEHASQGNFKAQVAKGTTVYGRGSYFESKTKITRGDVVQEKGGGFSRFFSLDAWAEKNLPLLIVPKSSKREKNTGVDLNKHPTVKPMKLMSYLIMLGSRPGDVILDPFAGSGTTGCAAIQLDREYILIEKEVEYFEIIKARIKYFEQQKKYQVLKI